MNAALAESIAWLFVGCSSAVKKHTDCVIITQEQIYVCVNCWRLLSRLWAMH